METQQTIGEWAESTFKHTQGGIALHLLSEAVELCMAAGCAYGCMRSIFEDAIANKKPTAMVEEEAADVVILVSALAHHAGFELSRVVDAKMEVNRARRWGEPNVHGISEHTDDSP